MFRKIAIAAAFAVLPLSSHAADSMSFDKAHTNIMFFINHLGFSEMEGEFRKFDGQLLLDQKDLSKSTISVKIEAASIQTDFDKLDEHLRSKDFFDATAFPTIEFKSTKVEDAGGGKLHVIGDLSMHGVTKPVTLDVTVNKIGPNPMNPKATKAGFSATATIKRSDFGISYGVPNVGDEVKLKLDSEWNPTPAAAPAG